MNKILLVYEDYADLMSVENTLKKVGFDVIGLTNEYTVAEQVLAFNPDLVVGSGRGGKVNSLGVGKRLKEMHRWQGKSVLIFPPQFRPDPQDLIRIRVDMMLEAPVPPIRLIQVIGKLLNHDESVLLERLNKTAAGHEVSPKPASTSTSVGGKFNIESESIYIKGRTEEIAKDAEERALRTEKISDDEGVNFSLENETSEENRKVSFKFGDRMSEAASSEAGKGGAERAASLFADVDLKALEKEIMGGGPPEMDQISSDEIESAPVDLTRVPELEPEASSAEDLLSSEMVRGGVSEEPSVSLREAGEIELKELQEKAQRELASAEKVLKSRVAKYANMVADVKVAPKSTVSRVEARRRQKQMAEEWDAENLSKLDELRRDFTKALFKK